MSGSFVFRLAAVAAITSVTALAVLCGLRRRLRSPVRVTALTTMLLFCGARAALGQAVVHARSVRAADSSTSPRIGDRVSVAGRVTLGWGVIDTSEVNIHVQDATGAVFVDAEAIPPGPLLAEGDSVVVTGKIHRSLGRNSLEDAIVTVVRRSRREPEAVRVAALTRDYLANLVGVLVTVEGRVLRAQLGRSDQTLTLADTSNDGVNVRVFNEATGSALLAFNRFSPGDRVRVTGVLEARTNPRTNVLRYTLYPRHADDLRPITMTAGARTVLWRSAGIAVPMLLLLGWGWRAHRTSTRARRKAAQELRDTAARYRTLLDQAPAAIVVHRDGRVVYANSAFEHLMGMAGPADPQNTYEQIISGAPDVETSLFDNEGHLRYREIVTLRRVDGTTAEVEITENKIEYEGEVCTQAILYDVSERRRAERALAESEAQLRQAQKLEAVGHLAGGVAHDFNNLLTTIKGNCEFLMSGCDACGTVAAEVREVDAAADRAAALTSQLLAFSRKQVIQPRVVEFDDLIGNMAVLLHRLVPESVSQHFDLRATNGLVLADPGQLEQVLLNLVVNARDAMPAGGDLAIRTANVTIGEEGSPDQAADGVPAGEYVQLTVSDTGCGMSAETQARVFEPFFTTKETGKGTGLGLSTVYGLIQQSRGHIRLHSVQGEGTTFAIYLPRAQASDFVEPLQLEPTLPQAAGETVLVVEDEPTIRQLAVRTLQQQGYRVLAAANGAGAMELAQTHDGPIHLLLTDVILPGMSGSLIAAGLRDLFPEIRVLYMSGYTDEHVAAHGVLEPGVELLEKPFTPSSLAERVARVLAHAEAGV